MSKEIKCPSCGELLEEKGRYPYRGDEYVATCDAYCSGCDSKFKIVIIKEE